MALTPVLAEAGKVAGDFVETRWPTDGAAADAQKAALAAVAANPGAHHMVRGNAAGYLWLKAYHGVPARNSP